MTSGFRAVSTRYRIARLGELSNGGALTANDPLR